MGINMKWSVILLSIMIWAALFSAAQAETYTLTVEGEGTQTVPADIVTISVSVASSNENMTVAQSEVGEEMDRVIAALKKAGIKDEEIVPGQGSGISSFQSSSKVCKTVNNTTVCENTTQSASTLQRSALIRLQAKDESRMNKALDAARSEGANAIVMGYSLKDSSSALTEAQKKALANARDNAEALAAEAGGSLGKALDIFTYPNLGIDYSFADSGDGRMIDISSRVIVTYEFIV